MIRGPVTTDGPRVVFEPQPEHDLYEWTRHWQRVESSPNHNGPVWGYSPTIGNDDEGYGYVTVVRCTLYPPRHQHERRDVYEWVDAHGNPIDVTHWAPLDMPEPPFPLTAKPPTVAPVVCD